MKAAEADRSLKAVETDGSLKAAETDGSLKAAETDGSLKAVKKMKTMSWWITRFVSIDPILFSKNDFTKLQNFALLAIISEQFFPGC